MLPEGRMFTAAAQGYLRTSHGPWATTGSATSSTMISSWCGYRLRKPHFFVSDRAVRSGGSWGLGTGNSVPQYVPMRDFLTMQE